jgi:hypothetical protein
VRTVQLGADKIAVLADLLAKDCLPGGVEMLQTRLAHAVGDEKVLALVADRDALARCEGVAGAFGVGGD